MLRRVVMFSLSLAPWSLGAQEQRLVTDGDTLHYTYTPLITEDANASVKMNGGKIEKNSWLNRIVTYFERSTEDRTFEKKIDVTFAGGPSYSKNTNFGIGLLASGLYRTDRSDSVTQPSNVAIFTNVSVSGFYAIGITGNVIWKRNSHRINYAASFSSTPRTMWGVGYEAGRHNPEVDYVEKNYRINADYLYRVMPNLFLGAALNFQHTRGIKFDNTAYLDNERSRYTAIGIGLIVEYDSRDFIPNPWQGIYVSVRELLFAKGLGSCGKTLWRTTVIVDWYRQVWSGGVVATDFYAEFNSPGTPWPMLARLGGNNRMRGYYQGRYTDNDLIIVQAELRQRIWRRIGGVVWGGAGNVFPELHRFDWAQTLPNYGIGLRWELKKRVNVRFDYGFGKQTSGFMLNINEAF